jgi:hypothetical protein
MPSNGEINSEFEVQDALLRCGNRDHARCTVSRVPKSPQPFDGMETPRAGREKQESDERGRAANEAA